MNTYQEVSLGFSEFVSQLIHETFDAILESQNYQLEKYAELQSKLDMPNDAYRKEFISEEELQTRITQFFNFEIQPKMSVNVEFNEFITNNFNEAKKMVYNKRLAKVGYLAIQSYISDMIIDEQKMVLQTLMNGSNATKLIVDSGEIIAKLELQNLYMSESLDENIEAIEKENPNKEKRTNADLEKNKAKKASHSFLNKKMYSKNENVGINEIIDTQTGKATILVNKEVLKNRHIKPNKIPNLRMTVKPTKLNTSSDLFTQVKINFKTV